jgi:hypothetical protein
MVFKKPVRLISMLLVIMILISGCMGQKIQQNPDDADGKYGDVGDTGETGDSNTDQAGNDSSGGGSDAGSNGTDSGQGSGISGSEEQTSGNGTEQGSGEGSDDASGAKEDDYIRVKALYLTGWTAGSTKNIEHYIELAKTTEINAYVVDIKDEDGYVGYESQVPEVVENKTWRKKYNPERLLEAFHDNDIYVIGRLVVFKDPVYSLKRPDLAIKHVNGKVWKDKDDISWLNPYNKETWDYIISIAKEAVAKGFDEIQFDYVRYPGGGKTTMDFSGTDKEKYEAINEFLAYAKEQITEVPISADVFGIILESPKDTENIGQYLELIGRDIDYISPMVYPSHYALGQIVNKVKFDVPDLKPYEVVYNSLVKCSNRISQVEGYKARVRPYLQDFTATWLVDKKAGKKYYQEYGPEQVRQQIQAVYDAGYEEWILWDARNTYSEEALLKEEE